MIIFTETRQLLDNSIVNEGEERDFGPDENAAFVNNGVAKWKVTPKTAPVAQEEKING